MTYQQKKINKNILRLNAVRELRKNKVKTKLSATSIETLRHFDVGLGLQTRRLLSYLIHSIGSGNITHPDNEITLKRDTLKGIIISGVYSAFSRSVTTCLNELAGKPNAIGFISKDYLYNVKKGEIVIKISKLFFKVTKEAIRQDKSIMKWVEHRNQLETKSSMSIYSHIISNPNSEGLVLSFPQFRKLLGIDRDVTQSIINRVCNPAMKSLTERTDINFTGIDIDLKYKFVSLTFNSNKPSNKSSSSISPSNKSSKSASKSASRSAKVLAKIEKKELEITLIMEERYKKDYLHAKKVHEAEQEVIKELEADKNSRCIGDNCSTDNKPSSNVTGVLTCSELIVKFTELGTLVGMNSPLTQEIITEMVSCDNEDDIGTINYIKAT